jgi:hypothetical protein
MLKDLTSSLNRVTITSGSPGDTTMRASIGRDAITPSNGDSSTVFDGDLDGNGDGDEVVDSAFEGSSSMTAQTAMASEFLEHAVTRTSLRDVSPGMQSALLSLQQIVGMQRIPKSTARESRFPRQKPMPKGGLRELPMPPSQVVVGLLREIKDSPPVTFTLICAFIAVEDFTDACRKVYFATEDYSVATFIIVNAGLYYLFQEKSVQDPSKAGALIEYHFMCRDNLECALGSLPLLMTPRKDNVEALLLGVSD